MSDTPNQVEIPIDVNTGSVPDALPNQAVTPDKPAAPERDRGRDNEPSIKPKENTEPLAKTTREAIERAAAKVDAAEKAKETPAQPKTPDGKFAPKTEVAATPKPQTSAPEQVQQPALPEKVASKYEAPARFSEAARKEWEAAPESVRAEVSRVLKENEDGITKYKANHESWEKVKHYDELAKRFGREGVHESLKQVEEMENTFARNPIDGFKAVANHFGFDVHKVASVILGQDPNQAVAEVHTQLQEARTKIAELQQQIDAPNVVREFAQKVGVDAFEANAEKVKQMLETGVVDTLDKAWALISIFGHSGSDPQNTASDATNSQPLIPAKPADAQTVAAAPQPNPAGQKTVSGAPGSIPITPNANKPSGRSIRESILNAASRA